MVLRRKKVSRTQQVVVLLSSRKDGVVGDGWQSLCRSTFALHLDENSDGSSFNTIVEEGRCQRVEKEGGQGQ